VKSAGIRLALAAGVLLAAAAATAQSWSEAYERATAAVGRKDYAAAKAAFNEAIALRPADQSGPTTLPGSLTEPVRWRGGSPYSPNFGLAYCTYREALAAPDDQRQAGLEAAVAAFETLIARGQASDGAYYFLYQSYGALRRVDKQREIEAQLKSAGTLPWKVDLSFVSPEEVSQVKAATSQQKAGPEIIRAGETTTPAGVVVTTPPDPEATSTARVPVVPTKFAFLVGNSEAINPASKLGFAASDAQMVREALIQSAGYDEANVDVVLNGTAESIVAAANALASRMPDDATLYFFFSGAAHNVAGKDFFAGIDAASPEDTSKMVAKSDIFQIFLNRGARIFAFHQCNRPVSNGRYFGQEEPLVGRIAQSHATVPGGSVFGLTSGGRETGLYAKAIYDVLTEFRSNSVPIMEFGWQVFNGMRGGSVASFGGQSRQTPTLPGVYNMSPDAKF
jgi:hypothetical protein